ncbi:glycosyltransferase family 39 protein [Nodosilinea sp. P-1105]|uniref:phospholipid carrier-dependent glycosyltransferase n=1 Tax=Nodosilinea sp. P-1105 TaxID=2546229 RepID=UPI00146EB956|nr:glycosyltransferase family 39 protein [Nodosilinea sp. P-1105]NMF84392.1 phospholipid carrier-dependent glycosyltransferase [Nodosilinea sp. P-1105]
MVKPLITMRSRRQDWLTLLALWVLATGFGVLWLWQDQAPPAWDQGEHLTRALNFWRVLQQPAWFDSAWWTELWRQSPGYRAPLVYLATVPLFNLLGPGLEQAILVNLMFAGLLMGLIYSLGCLLFGRQTGLWAAGLSLLVPALYALRLDYLIDLGLVVWITAAFSCLTGWRRWPALPAGQSKVHPNQWLWAAGFGLSAGLSVLAKPTGVLFLVVPVLWVITESLLSPHRWRYLGQWVLAAGLALLVCGPWIQTNWLTILTNSQHSNVVWIPPEVVPGSPWSAVSYYARMVPRMGTYAFLGAGILAALATLVGPWRSPWQMSWRKPWDRQAHLWLWGFLLGSYGVLTLLQNKDARHIAPAMPMLVLGLTWGLTQVPGRLGSGLRWLMAGLMTVLMVTTLMVPGHGLPSGRMARPWYTGAPWPHTEVVETMVQTAPYLQGTVGVLPNTAQINPQNIDFYGNLADFRVFGREVGFNPEFVPLDAQALTWALTKTGDQGPTSDPKLALAEQVEQDPAFTVVQTWDLPDQSVLSLHHRRDPPVTVTPSPDPAAAVAIATVTLPNSAAPGQTVPVTYELVGPLAALQQGVLLLSWRSQDQPDDAPAAFIHDHGIGLGQLLPTPDIEDDQTTFTVTERLGMVLPASLPPGTYNLSAEFLDRRTGDSYPLTIPTTRLSITTAPEPPQPPLAPDLVGTLHQLSQGLATGDLDPIFTTVGRINQYDPRQDYLSQAEVAMTHRLAQQPNHMPWLYTKAMAQVLQQDAVGAIATLQEITRVEPNNIFHWLYLAFVHLYRWQPGRASVALDAAAVIDPTRPELKALQAVAALQRFNLWQAWQRLQASGLMTATSESGKTRI